jgi:diguanylate cyclase (GGDEF)-like protein
MMDPLTGVLNRRGFEQAFARLTANAKLRGERLSAVAIDIDHFKQVNDAYGHDAGDKVLIHVAAILAASVRSRDIVGRVGGEEFMLLLPDVGIEDACRIADRLRDTLATSPIIIQDYVLVVTASFGVQELGRTQTPDTLLSEADQALYTAKATRNVVAAFGMTWSAKGDIAWI